MHIPSTDIERSANFYENVFGWTVDRQSPDRASFEDSAKTIGGAFVTNQTVSAEAGFLPYIYVDDIETTVQRIIDAGCEILTKPYVQGNVLVATFRDPSANVVGIWQAESR